jgi:hypothetical protein
MSKRATERKQMGEDFLAKVKGFKGVFVVHSNTNPSAAAAVMGMMAARSQEMGPYFRVSDSFVPLLEALLTEEPDNGLTPAQIEANFQSDWVTYLSKTGLPACGLNYIDSKGPEHNTIRFLNAHGKRIPAMKVRRIAESREFLVPPEYEAEYKELVEVVKAGGDLRPYLSRDILKKGRPDRNDGLLNSWGIQHLHFRHEGSDQLIFCVIAEDDVFMIQVLPHSAKHHLWVNTQLIQVLHDNWPTLIARGKHKGLQPEIIPANKRSVLRKYNANFPITVNDGTVYLPPAGGTMASGDSQGDWVNCDKIFFELKHWQSIITQNAIEIRAALNMPVSQRLVVRMAFDNHVCCFYEPSHAVRLGGFATMRR